MDGGIGRALCWFMVVSKERWGGCIQVWFMRRAVGVLSRVSVLYNLRDVWWFCPTSGFLLVFVSEASKFSVQGMCV